MSPVDYLVCLEFSLSHCEVMKLSRVGSSGTSCCFPIFMEVTTDIVVGADEICIFPAQVKVAPGPDGTGTDVPRCGHGLRGVAKTPCNATAIVR
jgi:hypothetical protein